MDPTPAPWRTIESSPPPGTVAGSDVMAGSTRRSGTALAVFVFAGLVAVASFMVAVGSSGGGSVEVDGGSPATLASGAAGPRGSSAASAIDGDQVVVEIVGAVVHPGVFHLPLGARVGDLVSAAGGFGPRVDTMRTGSLNLAAVLKDGDQVHVPSRDDAPATGKPATGPKTTGGSDAGATTLVDLNRATSAELEALPGIGPVTAGKIVASREGAGPFVAVDDLRTRKLVGEKVFEQLKSLVTVG